MPTALRSEPPRPAASLQVCEVWQDPDRGGTLRRSTGAKSKSGERDRSWDRVTGDLRLGRTPPEVDP